MLTNLFHLRQQTFQVIPEIDVHSLQARLDQGEDVYLLDVRSSEEFAAGHLWGSHLMPLFTIPLRQIELPKGRPIVIVCRSGARSQIACEQLIELGFANVINLQGGILAWQRAGLSLVPDHSF